MKSEQFNYSTKKSAIRGKKEKKRTAKNRNWDRIIYLVILAVLFLGLLYYLTANYFTVRGEGRLMSDQVTLRAPIDISMDDFYTRVGKQIQEGDSLFMYHSFEEKTTTDSLVRIRERSVEKREDLFDVQENAARKRQNLQSLKDKLGYYQQQKQLVEREIKLNVETVPRLRNVEENIIELSWDIEAMEQELGYLYQRRNRIQDSMKSLQVYSSESGSAGADGITSGERLFRSPVSGMVSNIYKEPSEFAFKEEEIIAIKTDSARIIAKAVFDREDAPDLEKGTELNIRFYNGEPSMGKVVDIYSANANLDPILNATGIETSKKIVVEMEPINANVRKQWQSSNGMGLTAYKSLF